MSNIFRTATVALLVCGIVVGAIGGCATTTAGAGKSEVETTGRRGDKINPDPADIAQGRQIAERTCAACHAIDQTSKSPRAGAPPLRDVLEIYQADNLANRLIEGMRVGHDGMPVIDLDVRSADSLIAYITTISGPGH